MGKAIKHYRNFDIDDDGGALYSEQYGQHISAMTGEQLYSKSEIALELAVRDIRIEELEKALSWAKNDWTGNEPSESVMQRYFAELSIL